MIPYVAHDQARTAKPAPATKRKPAKQAARPKVIKAKPARSR